MAEVAEHADLIAAIDLVLSGDWESAHTLVQRYGQDRNACWIHAVLHKIEGDAGNSRYWYARTDAEYSDYEDATAELKAIRQSLTDRTMA